MVPATSLIAILRPPLFLLLRSPSLPLSLSRTHTLRNKCFDTHIRYSSRIVWQNIVHEVMDMVKEQNPPGRFLNVGPGASVFSELSTQQAHKKIYNAIYNLRSKAV